MKSLNNPEFQKKGPALQRSLTLLVLDVYPARLVERGPL